MIDRSHWVFATIDGKPSMHAGGGFFDDRNAILKCVEVVIRKESDFLSKDDWLNELVFQSSRVSFIDDRLQHIEELKNVETYKATLI